MKMSDYVSRIGIDDVELLPNIETLKRLQKAHLTTVPFENLDIHWKRPIVLDIEKFFAKIVSARRGGFCYELNGLFDVLLRSIGFRTRLISARVFNGTEFGPEFDHAAIIVTIGGDEYLSDVGFGAFSAEPLRFVIDVEQHDPEGVFVIRKFDDKYFEVAKQNDGIWISEYIFQDIARELTEFEEMCDFQQYSTESHFTKGKLCSIMTESGRKTLTDNKFVATTNGEKTETPVLADNGFYSLLEREFQIVAERS